MYKVFPLLVAAILLIACKESNQVVVPEDEKWEEVKNRFVSVTTSIDSFYLESNSVEEMSKRIAEIKKVDGVVNAYSTNTCVYVEIEGWGTVGYPFYDYDDIAWGEESVEYINQLSSKLAVRSGSDEQHPFDGDYSAYILNAQHLERQWTREVVDATEKMFNACGFKVKYEEYPIPNFFQNEIFNHDLVFIITHGEYDPVKKLHWVVTLETIAINDDVFERERRLKEMYDVENDELRAFRFADRRGNDEGIVFRTAISEKYIQKATKRFAENGKAVIFMGACQSLMGNTKKDDDLWIDDSMAQAFFDKGAGLYIGYDERSSSLAQFGGMRFFANLLCGESFEKALDFPKSDEALLHSEDGATYKKEHCTDTKPDGSVDEWDVAMHILPDNGFRMDSFISAPNMLSDDYLTEDGYLFKACADFCPDVDLYIEVWRDYLHFSFVNEDRPIYGFAISKGMDPSVGACYPASVTRNGEMYWVLFDLSLPFGVLEPDTEYRIWPYIAVGTSFNYGKPMVFKTIGESTSVQIPEPLDLGLSVKWASFNLGASKPEEYGDYYAWGETAYHYHTLSPLYWKPGMESGYDWPTYEWYDVSSDRITKYDAEQTSCLEPEDDVAQVILGDKWRTPTEEEWKELWLNCTFTWTTQEGVKGLSVTSRKPGYTNVSLFLPAAGALGGKNWQYDGESGFYWTSCHSASDNKKAGCYSFETGGSDMTNAWIDRCYGLSVRPVYGDQMPPTTGDIEGTEEHPWN